MEEHAPSVLNLIPALVQKSTLVHYARVYNMRSSHLTPVATNIMFTCTMQMSTVHHCALLHSVRPKKLEKHCVQCEYRYGFKILLMLRLPTASICDLWYMGAIHAL